MLITARKRSCEKVMFSRACVILFTGGFASWGVLGEVCLLGGGGGGVICLNTILGQITLLRDTNTTGYGQQAGGTHPTRMNSCYLIVLLNAFENICRWVRLKTLLHYFTNPLVFQTVLTHGVPRYPGLPETLPHFVMLSKQQRLLSSIGPRFSSVERY